VHCGENGTRTLMELQALMREKGKKGKEEKGETERERGDLITIK
jgi:hypothetical protein